MRLAYAAVLYTMYTRRGGGEVQAPPELPMNPPLTLCILFAPVMPKSCADLESFVGVFLIDEGISGTIIGPPAKRFAGVPMMAQH